VKRHADGEESLGVIAVLGGDGRQDVEERQGNYGEVVG
jgi:hypothetical protein